MASKEEEIQNCWDNEDTQKHKNIKVNKECKSLNKPTIKYFSSTLEKNCTVKKELQCSFHEVNRIVEGEDSIKILIAKSNAKDKPEGCSGLNSTLTLKDEECSLSEKCKELSQTDDSILDICQKSCVVGQSSTEYDIDFKRKSENEELLLCSSSKKYFASPPAPSMQKVRSTKRRAGILYKQLSNSKFGKITSQYFSHAHNNNKKRWIPPRSPYALVQEDLFDNPWQLLVATIFLTKTTAKKALPQLHQFLARYPQPEDVLRASYEDIDEYFKPLGLITTRSHIIMRFTVEFLEKDWTYPRELYGIGKYGDDSYRIFCINEWRQVSPDDIPLTQYRNWLLENAERLGLD